MNADQRARPPDPLPTDPMGRQRRQRSDLHRRPPGVARREARDPGGSASGRASKKNPAYRGPVEPTPRASSERPGRRMRLIDAHPRGTAGGDPAEDTGPPARVFSQSG